MKLVVGVLLTSFGLFWGVEGAGADWPGADLALLGVIPAVFLMALIFIALLRNRLIPGTAVQPEDAEVF
jgi:uncharacterized membrane protein